MANAWAPALYWAMGGAPNPFCAHRPRGVERLSRLPVPAGATLQRQRAGELAVRQYVANV